LFRRPPDDDLQCLAFRLGCYGVRAGLDDRCLFSSDLLNGVSEYAGVLQRDIGDNRDVTVDGVGGVEAPAHAGVRETRVPKAEEATARRIGVRAAKPKPPVTGKAGKNGS